MSPASTGMGSPTTAHSAWLATPTALPATCLPLIAVLVRLMEPINHSLTLLPAWPPAPLNSPNLRPPTPAYPATPPAIYVGLMRPTSASIAHQATIGLILIAIQSALMATSLLDLTAQSVIIPAKYAVGFLHPALSVLLTIFSTPLNVCLSALLGFSGSGHWDNAWIAPHIAWLHLFRSH